MNYFAFTKFACAVLLVFVVGCVEESEPPIAKPPTVPHKRFSIDLNDGSYEREIRSGVSAIDFWAPSCGWCVPMGENFETVAEKLEGKVKFFKINVDTSPKATRSFGVQALPTLWVVVDGKPVKHHEGFMNVDEMLTLLKKYIEEKND